MGNTFKSQQIRGVTCVRVRNPFAGWKVYGWAYYDGSAVRVWDSVGLLFTAVHSLTPAQQRSVRSRCRAMET